MRLPPRLLPDRVTWRRVTTTRNDFGETETTSTDTEVSANVQPMGESDEIFVGGVGVDDMRRVFMRETPDPETDALVIGGEVFSVREVEAWPGYSRVRCQRATA